MAGAAIDVILFDLGGVLVELAGVEKMLEWSPGIDTHRGAVAALAALGRRAALRDRRARTATRSRAT